MHPEKFQIVFNRDARTTGNFEVVVRKKADPNDKGKMVHSKKGGQGYPHNDWTSFHARLDAAMK